MMETSELYLNEILIPWLGAVIYVSSCLVVIVSRTLTLGTTHCPQGCCCLPSVCSSF